MSERLMAQIDRALLVRYDTAGYLMTWFGGENVHIYDARGNEHEGWTMGDYDDTLELDEQLARIEASMSNHLRETRKS